MKRFCFILVILFWSVIPLYAQDEYIWKGIGEGFAEGVENFLRERERNARIEEIKARTKLLDKQLELLEKENKKNTSTSTTAETIYRLGFNDGYNYGYGIVVSYIEEILNCTDVKTLSRYEKVAVDSVTNNKNSSNLALISLFIIKYKLKELEENNEIKKEGVKK